MNPDSCIGIYGSADLWREMILSLRARFAPEQLPLIINPEPGDTRQFIMLGPSFRQQWPARYIMYNAEQPGYGWLEQPEALHKAHAAVAVWDLSPAMLPYWHKRGVEARYMPLIPCDAWTTAPVAPDPAACILPSSPIDFVLLGSHTPRRNAIYEILQRAGHSLFTPNCALFGAEREAAYSCARCVLNLHAHSDNSGNGNGNIVLESMRILPALWHGHKVLSERAEEQLELPNLFYIGGSAGAALHTALHTTPVPLEKARKALRAYAREASKL